jgi:hypothetical protein
MCAKECTMWLIIFLFEADNITLMHLGKTLTVVLLIIPLIRVQLLYTSMHAASQVYITKALSARGGRGYHACTLNVALCDQGDVITFCW